jgi:hypothetical protein
VSALCRCLGPEFVDRLLRCLRVLQILTFFSRRVAPCDLFRRARLATGDNGQYVLKGRLRSAGEARCGRVKDCKNLFEI